MVRPSCPRLWNPVVCSRATANDGPKGGTWKRWPSESCMANKTKKATTLRQNTRSKGPIQLVMYFMTIQLKPHTTIDRKSTRLNSSHVKSSYAVFCLNKKIVLT